MLNWLSAYKPSNACGLPGGENITLVVMNPYSCGSNIDVANLPTFAGINLTPNPLTVWLSACSGGTTLKTWKIGSAGGQTFYFKIPDTTWLPSTAASINFQFFSEDATSYSNDCVLQYTPAPLPMPAAKIKAVTINGHNITNGGSFFAPPNSSISITVADTNPLVAKYSLVIIDTQTSTYIYNSDITTGLAGQNTTFTALIGTTLQGTSAAPLEIRLLESYDFNATPSQLVRTDTWIIYYQSSFVTFASYLDENGAAHDLCNANVNSISKIGATITNTSSTPIKVQYKIFENFREVATTNSFSVQANAYAIFYQPIDLSKVTSGTYTLEALSDSLKISDDSCTFTWTNPNPPTPPTTGYSCVNGTCATTPQGTMTLDQCKAACSQSSTHKECHYGKCIDVNGSGTNQCTGTTCACSDLLIGNTCVPWIAAGGVGFGLLLLVAMMLRR